MARCWLGTLLLFLAVAVLARAVGASKTAESDDSEKCEQPNATRIILWAVMRSGSSALSRAFAQRSDTWVLFEPFTKVHYLGPEREHPRHMDLAPDPKFSYRNVWDELLAPPGGKAVSFAKDFASILPRRWWHSTEMARVRHSFLIRHPAPTMTSMLRACGVDDRDRTGYSYFNETEVGFDDLLALYEYVTKQLHQEPPVIDHDDLVEHPEAVLRKLLSSLNLEFDDRMLNWTRPLPPHPEIWRGFFDNSNTSSGFKVGKRDRVSAEAPPEIADAIARAMPAYDFLWSRRLQI